ncbi:YfaZ family outer membrane protein [Shewanella sp. NIFS-20-20]|uniref:YfaZ family outer membrane protein n=1 Tax=Shewanella sp. NIFS-20-20 TaxID=2853806 RepID=UPI001C47C63E|nr:YfaZ family outer membrane protein [Shewanella sp. NIFS-20-20]MBV7317338.1 YfaZ family protein [Shewanella sp. NIFS-20-20]
MTHFNKSLLLLAAMTLPASAAEFNLGLNDDVVSAELTTKIAYNANAGINYIYSDNNGHLLQVASHLTHDAGAHHLEFGVQYSQLWSDLSPNGGVLAIGGRYAIDLGSKLSWHAAGYYTPSVLAFGKLDGHYEGDTKIQFDLTPTMGFYAGYRYIHFEYDHAKDTTFDSGFYLGMKARF